MRRGTGRPRGSVDRCGRAYRVDHHIADRVVLAFGDQIRRAREDADVSASELAAAVGVHVDTIHRYEGSRARPSLHSLVAIAMALRVPVDHLVPEC